jgi:transcriptional regulator with XRE-family HTH domain
MTSLAYDITAPLLDESAIEELLADVATASDALSRSTSVPDEVRALVISLPSRLRADTPTNALAGDPYLSESAYAGAARAAAALLDTDERAKRREVRLALEQVRQALRDLLEHRPVDEDVPADQVAAWLENTLGLPQQQLADLVGTSVRTWQRWLTGTTPDPAQALRLRRIARLTMHLRHALTGPGVAGWFTRQHPLIKGGGGSPIELLADPDGYQRLLALAAGLRSTQAS